MLPLCSEKRRSVSIGGQRREFKSGQRFDQKGTRLYTLFGQIEATPKPRIWPLCAASWSSTATKESGGWPITPDWLLFFDREFAKVDRLIAVLQQSDISRADYEYLIDEATWWKVQLPAIAPGESPVVVQLPSTLSDKSDKLHSKLALDLSQIRSINVGGRRRDFISGLFNATGTAAGNAFDDESARWKEKIPFFDREFAKVDRLIAVIQEEIPISAAEYLYLKSECEFWEVRPKVLNNPTQLLYFVGHYPPGQVDYKHRVIAKLQERANQTCPDHILTETAKQDDAHIVLHFGSLGLRPENPSDQEEVLNECKNYNNPPKRTACVVFLTAHEGEHSIPAFKPETTKDFEQTTTFRLFEICITPNDARIPAGGNNDTNLAALLQFAMDVSSVAAQPAPTIASGIGPMSCPREQHHPDVDRNQSRQLPADTNAQSATWAEASEELNAQAQPPQNLDLSSHLSSLLA